MVVMEGAMEREGERDSVRWTGGRRREMGRVWLSGKSEGEGER